LGAISRAIARDIGNASGEERRDEPRDIERQRAVSNVRTANGIKNEREALDAERRPRRPGTGTTTRDGLYYLYTDR